MRVLIFKIIVPDSFGLVGVFGQKEFIRERIDLW